MEKENISPITIRSYEHLGSTIRRLRKLQGLTQAELGKKAGVTQARISNFERAKASVEIETVIMIFAALNLDIVVAPRPKSSIKDKSMLEDLY